MGFLSLWHGLLSWTLIVLSFKTLNTAKMKNDFTVSDCLPSPKDLALKDETVKVTITLSKTSIDF